MLTEYFKDLNCFLKGENGKIKDYETVKFKDEENELNVQVDCNQNIIWLSIGDIAFLFWER